MLSCECNEDNGDVDEMGTVFSFIVFCLWIPFAVGGVVLIVVAISCGIANIQSPYGLVVPVPYFLLGYAVVSLGFLTHRIVAFCIGWAKADDVCCSVFKAKGPELLLHTGIREMVLVAFIVLMVLNYALDAAREPSYAGIVRAIAIVEGIVLVLYASLLTWSLCIYHSFRCCCCTCQCHRT